ncbi:MAG TPA: rhodanese-like domain-containing protein [Candidatus Acidoferrales bacterium]|nr:rhodanese-like domain-containing protein [Candidatus Acidoferrales bacterium]
MPTKSLRPDRIDTATTPVLDVRAHRGSRQIRGSVHYDPKHLLEAPRLALPFKHDADLAVYGDSDTLVDAVLEKLQRAGYAGAARLEGGIQGWIDAGLPVEELTQEQPIPGDDASGIQLL